MRPDLAKLQDDVLVDLANRGLVKRAHKLVGRGEPTVTWDGDVPTGTFSDGVVTSLGVDVGLAATACSCAAPGICRHRLALVIACRDAPTTAAAWTPAFDDAALLARLGATALARAERSQAGVVVELSPGPPPTAHLGTCTVRFLVEGELRYATCDCAETDCEHLAHAVWAFRRGGQRVELAPGLLEVDASGLDALIQLTDDVLWAGVDRSTGLAQRLARIARDVQELTWPAEVCDSLGEQLGAYHAASARYTPAALAELLVDPWARRTAGPETFGASVARETRLEKARFSGLGLRARPADDGVRLEVFLVEARGGGVLVCEREVPGDAPGAWNRELGGVRIGRLATSRVLTRVARRRANRAMAFGTGPGNTSVSSPRWDDLPAQVRGFPPPQRLPVGLRPRHRVGQVRVLDVDAVLSVGWDPAEQQLVADAVCHEQPVRIVLGHSALTPGACAALAEALPNARRLSGHVTRAGGAWQIEPLAVETDQVHVPALAAARPISTQVVSSAPTSPLADTVAQVRSTLDEAAHAGLAAFPADRIEAASTRCAQVGLSGCAERLGVLATALRGARSGGSRTKALEAWRRAWLRLAAVSERV